MTTQGWFNDNRDDNTCSINVKGGIFAGMVQRQQSQRRDDNANAGTTTLAVPTSYPRHGRYLRLRRVGSTTTGTTTLAVSTPRAASTSSQEEEEEEEEASHASTQHLINVNDAPNYVRWFTPNRIRTLSWRNNKDVKSKVVLVRLLLRLSLSLLLFLLLFF